MIDVQKLEDGVIRAALSGRIDFAGAQSIDAPMKTIAGEVKALVIDLSKVEFMASMGLRILIMSAKTVHGRKGRIALYGAGKGVSDVIEMSGVDELIPTFANEADAVAAVKAA